MMKTLLLLPAAAALISLAGCGNRPTTVTEITPVESMSIVHHRNYSAIDTFSFTQAKVQYPAENGYHSVPVGTYFLSRIIDKLPAGYRKYQLTAFDGECERTGTFMPHVICRISATVTAAGPKSKEIKFAAERDVGNHHVKSEYTVSGQTDYGDDEIKKQVKDAIDALAESSTTS